MKSLIVYYSRSGKTKKLSESISKEINCNLEEIVSKRGRNGTLGFLISGYEASRKKLAKIGDMKNDPSIYDLVIIGTPIWAGRMSSPVRTYITKNRDRFPKVAFFITHGGADAGKAMAELQELCGKKPVGTLAVRTTDVNQGKYLQNVKEFVAAISKEN
jgi:flavodoxin